MIYKNYIFIIFILTALNISILSCSKNDAFKPNPNFEAGESTLPTMYISMSDGECQDIHASREIKVTAECQIVSQDRDTLYNGPLYVKTRGHYTFRNDKKPYSINFPFKIRLFNLYRSKHYVLLANVADWSYIRNAIAFDVAERMGLPAPRYTYLRVFVNGDYRGLYQLTNKVEVNKEYFPIINLESENKHINLQSLREYPMYDTFNKRGGEERRGEERRGRLLSSNPMDISGGYIIDHHVPETSDCGFKSIYGKSIRIKSPKHASIEQVNYIASLYNNMEVAVCDPNGIHPTTGKYYTEYVDLESFARYYLIEEWMKNNDAGTCSFIMYKDVDSKSDKMHAGPIWDFDATRVDIYNELWSGTKMGRDTSWNSGGLLYHLYQHEDFRQKVESLFVNEMFPIIDEMFKGEYTDSLFNMIRKEAKTDAVRWGRDRYSFDIQWDEVLSFLSNRKDFLYWLYTSDANDRVCLTIDNREKVNARKILRYNNKQNGVFLKVSYPIFSNNDPIVTTYFTGTDRVIEHDTTFMDDAFVTMEYEYPSWFEVQKRRVKKKLKKTFKYE